MLTHPSKAETNQLKSFCQDRGILLCIKPIKRHELYELFIYELWEEKVNEYIGAFDNKDQVIAFVYGMEYHAKLKSEFDKS